MSLPTPIVVMSFNRPEYLIQVLDSLVRQQGCDFPERPVFLFQDGLRNPFSRRAHGKAEQVEDSIAAFRNRVPHGTVMASPHNLGVALNFDRAERFVFRELAAEAAIFLEDDMVLSPHYIASLDRMIAAYADDVRVGYVAAYGDHALSLEQQRVDPTGLQALHHNWAFAVYRRQWEAMRPRVEAYLDLLREVDYRARSHERIADLFVSWGFGRLASSQDAAKTLACLLTHSVKIRSRACLGRYIGEKGLHMRPDEFAKRGFANTELYPDPLLDFPPLSPAVHKAIDSELRRWARKPPVVAAASAQ